MKFVPLILLLGLVGCVQVLKPLRDPIVSAEELHDSPETFAGKRVIATGYWNAGFEVSSFSDESNAASSTIWVQLPDSFSSSPNQSREINEAIHQTLIKAGSSPYPQYVAARLWIRCEGVFDHSDSSAGNTSTSGFGHLNAYKSKLTITRVFEAKIVLSD